MRRMAVTLLVGEVVYDSYAAALYIKIPMKL